MNKSKLEHKLYLARENPEPVFDLAECGLQNVPGGVYSLCRVFLKESLRLENNCLSSLSGGGNLKDLYLLRILDISLQEFYGKDNHLKTLCVGLCKLTNLRILDISNNAIKELPEDIGNLTNLRKCNLSNNKFKRLPKTIHKWQKINTFNLESNSLVFPPNDVIQNGLEYIMKYLCELEEVPFNYAPCEDSTQDETDHRGGIPKSTSFQQQKIKLDAELNRLQHNKEYERFQLIEQLQEAENNADLAISHLLSSINEPLGQLLEQEKLEEERMLAAINRYNDTLRKEDVLLAMENILAQETVKFREFDQSRIDSSRSILEQEMNEILNY
ncbi:hypothetical protein JTB14_009593 [Gonioctena quinquepunctata]|nr:hypothetical protein JTB14_009593 [Gonioctena quinquepunctata]